MRFSEAFELGLSKYQLNQAMEAGLIRRVARGLYRLESAPIDQHLELQMAARKYPSAVICLISALSYHGLTTQIPHWVDLAVRRTSSIVPTASLKIQLYKMTNGPLQAGICNVRIGNVEVKIFDPEKSVVDVFKYRNKIGLDVALEALRFWVEKRRGKASKLYEYAELCRMSNVMRPYLEAVL